MNGNNLNDLLSKLSLDSENEDRLTFFLSLLRRKGKSSYIISKKAAFIYDTNVKKWTYLELRRINDIFVWGCKECQDIKTFRAIETGQHVIDSYCIHALAACMLWDTDELKTKYYEEKEDLEIVNDDPYLAVAHAGEVPAIIHFPRQTKSANCSEHPGAHKGKKTKCEHLSLYSERFRDCQTRNGSKQTRSKTKQSDKTNQQAFLSDEICSDKSSKYVKREPNPYKIGIPFLPGKQFQDKYKSITQCSNPYPSNLVPNPSNKSCKEHGNKFCSAEKALKRYLVISDKVFIHDIFQVKDSRDSVCRVFYLDTAAEDESCPPCDCRLFYTGEEDQLLPISTPGKDHTFHVVSYRMLLDFLLLEQTDGTSESGYIKAFNRRRGILYGNLGKECSKKVWLMAVSDFQHALVTDEKENFTCSKCPSADSIGDGLDEVHIGDGVSEGTQVDLVPHEVVELSREPIPCK